MPRVGICRSAWGTKIQSQTDSEGEYTLPLLLPGEYTITVEMAGFKTYVRQGVHLDSGGHMDSPHLDSAIRIKNNAMRGGSIENIFVRNVDVGQVAVAGLSIEFLYEEGAAGSFTPVVRHVELRNISVQNTKFAVFLRGLPNAPICGVRMTDCVFEKATQSSIVENALEMSLENVRINGKPVEKFGV